MATEERVKLLIAARKGIYEDVVSLSKLQIPLGDYIQPPHNRTAFWYSCRNGSLKMAKIILKKGSNINHKDINGISPLHICVKHGHLSLAKFLLENNANINIKDNDGQTPIFYAIINRHYDIVKLLIENGADVSIKDNNNASVYDYADFTGKTKLSTYILYKSNELIVKNTQYSLNKD
ncbi:ankyrin-repeat protein, putative [Plasmodium gallinaceum]|uniref:Ankyrin-repeat protein, putative n=1 Tax=Plasmodium gallinaceum TaxID=5849 RepID=A0A1J1GPD3_PLAGA|nr:ankyrin-repeat protein, putative [Plasmodium gallinaceum]CRG94164.1 ankyrin-repeat protein, putative [Plasmodium gallinaceum]